MSGKTLAFARATMRAVMRIVARARPGCEARARARIAENLASAGFLRLWRDTPAMCTPTEQQRFKAKFGDVETPAAVMPAGLVASGSRVMWLSQQTIGKIKARHANVQPQHMLLAQAALDGPHVFEQIPGAKWIAFTRDSAGAIARASGGRSLGSGFPAARFIGLRCGAHPCGNLKARQKKMKNECLWGGKRSPTDHCSIARASRLYQWLKHSRAF